MPQNIILSLDAMGGANAPTAIIEGASIALRRYSNLYFKIFGNKQQLETLLCQYDNLKGSYELIDTKSFILDDEQPIKALKGGLNSSMRKAIDSVKEGSASACVSSGNTGALMVMSKVVLGEIPGIKRPAIVGIMPNLHGGTVVLDLGANAECDENNLFQFALMGDCFAKVILNKQNPTIGLLNVGVEQIKGRELEKKTYELLKDCGLNFIGFVEGCDVTKGVVDVIVTDGFTGNIALKTAEGAATFLINLMKSGFQKNIFSKLGGLLARKALQESFKRVDPNINNGAMFIGINGVVVKSHGSSEAIGFANAIGVAYDLVKRNINQEIIKELDLIQQEISLGKNIVEKIKRTSAKILGIS
jgi:glycerol-3-phosphate acyltransferase PlsX